MKSQLGVATADSLDELIEKLAAIEHERWADWQKWMHSTFVTRTDGAMKYRTVLPLKLVERWERQITTPYAELSEAEKQSDRDQVMRYWPLIQALQARAVNDARIETEAIVLKKLSAALRGRWHENPQKVRDAVNKYIDKRLQHLTSKKEKDI